MLDNLYFACLSVSFFLGLFVSNKRQNSWTDRAQILCGSSYNPSEGLWMVKSSKICLKNWFSWKELSFCHKLWFSNFNIVATQCGRPLIFQTMNSVRSNNVSLKYQRFTSSGCKDIGFTKTEFVAKTQFLWKSRKGNGSLPQTLFF